MAYKKGVPVVKILQGYYPFGMTYQNYSQSRNGGRDNYTYGRKELQPETGWLDYGARMYSPDLGRWFSLDQESERGYNLSPYNYSFNNPISYTDPDGNWPKWMGWHTRTAFFWESSQVKLGKRLAAATGGSFKKFNKALRKSSGFIGKVDIKGTSTYYNLKFRTNSDDDREPKYGYDMIPITEFSNYYDFFEHPTTLLANNAIGLGIVLEELLVIGLPGITISSDGTVDVDALLKYLLKFAHKPKKQSTGSKKRTNGRHAHGIQHGKRVGKGKNNKRGKKNKKYKPEQNPNKNPDKPKKKGK